MTQSGAVEQEQLWLHLQPWVVVVADDDVVVVVVLVAAAVVHSTAPWVSWWCSLPTKPRTSAVEYPQQQ
jgi:hypothetical protein